MGAPQGFLAHGLITGTITYFVLGMVASVIALQFFTKETPNITKSDSRRLGLMVVWMSTICMWLFWAFVYMHQMVPIIMPVHTANGER
mmetsp:Transcript_12116/g.27711  ORF Transcript_12116/g.27711 Transcript_12116/m.27711 type:complete len:88 (-) Transcript_12116:140-403(-)